MLEFISDAELLAKNTKASLKTLIDSKCKLEAEFALETFSRYAKFANRFNEVEYQGFKKQIESLPPY